MSTIEGQPEQHTPISEPASALIVQPAAEPAAAESDPAAPATPVVEPSAGPRRKRRERGWLSASVESLAGTVVIAVFVITFIVQAFQIPSNSMENTLLVGDYLLVDKVHFGEGDWWGKLLPYRAVKRGDIIVFRWPVHPEQHFVKRVIGVPGDHIRLVNKQVYVNGRAINEKYVVYRSAQHDSYRDDFPRTDYLRGPVEPFWWTQLQRVVQHGELVVPSNQYFVMGDNRDDSSDSRYWGFVPRENIIGRPLLIYWSVANGEHTVLARDDPGDKLTNFAYAVTHVFRETRWNRTFRLVK